MTSPTEILSVVLLAAGVSVMLVVHVLVIFWALRRRRGLGSRGTPHAEDDGGQGGGGGLSAAELVALPCHEFMSADGRGAVGDCAVCLEAFEAGDRCRQLPRCEHSFHAECVDSWLRKSNACPVCRAYVADRPTKGDAKAATTSGPGVMEMAERTSSNAALELEVITER